MDKLAEQSRVAIAAIFVLGKSWVLVFKTGINPKWEKSQINMLNQTNTHALHKNDVCRLA